MFRPGLVNYSANIIKMIIPFYFGKKIREKSEVPVCDQSGRFLTEIQTAVDPILIISCSIFSMRLFFPADLLYDLIS